MIENTVLHHLHNEPDGYPHFTFTNSLIASVTGQEMSKIGKRHQNVGSFGKSLIGAVNLDISIVFAHIFSTSLTRVSEISHQQKS